LRQIGGLVRDYNELHRILRQRHAELRVTMASLDDIAGCADNYISKILAPSQMRALGRRSMGPILGALGLALVVIEDHEQMRRIRSRLIPRRERRNRARDNARRPVEPPARAVPRPAD
jgi:hypothetical protein